MIIFIIGVIYNYIKVHTFIYFLNDRAPSPYKGHSSPFANLAQIFFHNLFFHYFPCLFYAKDTLDHQWSLGNNVFCGLSLLWTTWRLSSSSLQLNIIFVPQTVIYALPQSTHTCSLPWSNSLKFLWPTVLLELNTLCSVLLNKHMKRYSNSAIRWVNNKIPLCNQNT